MMRFIIKNIFALFFVLISSCTSVSKEEKGAELYQMHCAQCHVAPDINDLPKKFWTNSILPEMAARMGIKEAKFNKYSDMEFEEMELIHKSGIYPYKPVMSPENWDILKNYILAIAPDSLSRINHEKELIKQDRFLANPIDIDDVPGSFFTLLKYNSTKNLLWTGDYTGKVTEYDFATGKSSIIHAMDNAVVDYVEKDTVAYITDIGILDPSELSTGKIIAAYGEEYVSLPDTLHRPVNNLVIDLNNNGLEEMVVSEFGHLTGQLSLLYLDSTQTYRKKVLLNQPGAIRSMAKDMNKDGKLDIITLTSQGDESITILYQQDNLIFRSEKVLRFSPIYGSSWFELVDYDGDGDDDIITVNGDNADKTYISKPYHGLRIHLNDGHNNFSEVYFYPLYGATRFTADDFDQDGDMDFTIISTFPDYENEPEYSLIYLENQQAENYDFQPYSFDEANQSRWLLMDKGDVDLDGDMDIILSSFTYVFTPVPTEITEDWAKNNIDVMVLKNTLND